MGLRGILEGKGNEVFSSFDCRGQITLVDRGHPDEKDMEDARALARGLKVGRPQSG